VFDSKNLFWFEVPYDQPEDIAQALENATEKDAERIISIPFILDASFPNFFASQEKLAS